MKLLDMLKIATQYLLPKHAVSRLVGYLAAAGSRCRDNL